MNCRNAFQIKLYLENSAIKTASYVGARIEWYIIGKAILVLCMAAWTGMWMEMYLRRSESYESKRKT